LQHVHVGYPSTTAGRTFSMGSKTFHLAAPFPADSFNSLNTIQYSFNMSGVKAHSTT